MEMISPWKIVTMGQTTPVVCQKCACSRSAAHASCQKKPLTNPNMILIVADKTEADHLFY